MRPYVHLNRCHFYCNSFSVRKLRRQLWTLPLFGLIVVMPGTALFGQIRTETVAETGVPSLDGNGLFGVFSFNVLINESGEVVFESNLTATSGGTTDDLGLFREFDGSMSQIVREGEDAPDGNGRFQSFNFPHIDNQGSVVFRSTLSDTSGGSADSTGIFEGNGGVIGTIARAGQPVPEGNGVYSTFTAPDPNNGNRMAFTSILAQTSGGMADNSGIYLASGGTPSNIVRSGEVAPDGNGVYSSFSTALTNSPGQVSFAANLTATIGGATDDEGIFRASDETVVQVFRTGTAAPDGNGTFLSLPQTFFPINDLGQIAFEASLTGTTGGATDDGGIFRGPGGPLTQIMRFGQPSPDGNGVFSGVGFAQRLNQSGHAIFVGTLTGTSGGTSDNLGLYVADGIETIQVAREGVLAPDSNGTIESFLNDVYLNDSGVALFNPRLVGTTGGTADNSVILLADGIETIQVARKGQMLDGSSILALGFAISRTGTAINNYGQTVYVANLADGENP